MYESKKNFPEKCDKARFFTVNGCRNSYGK